MRSFEVTNPNEGQISIFFKRRRIILQIEALELTSKELVSISTYDFKWTERLKYLGQPLTSSEARGLRDLYHPPTLSEAKD